MRNQGAGIVVGPQVEAPFQRYAQTPPRDCAFPIIKVAVLESDRVLVFAVKVAEYHASSWCQLSWVMRESFLNDAEASTTCAFRYGCKGEYIMEQGSEVEMQFLNDTGSSEIVTTHPLIGVDGASSMIRSLTLPESKCTCAGYVVLRCLIRPSYLSKVARDFYDGSITTNFGRKSQALIYNIHP